MSSKVACLVALISATLVEGCNSVPEHPPSAAIEIVEHESARLSDLVEIQTVIWPELTSASALGGIDIVQIDPTTRDVLVGDLGATERIYRFDSAGKYLQNYGPINDSPGFILSEDNAVVALTSQSLIRYNRDGTVEANVPIHYLPHGAARVGDRICVRALHVHEGHSETVYCYNSKLAEQKRFGRMDPRLARYRLATYRPIGADAKRFYITDYYDPSFDVYTGALEPSLRWELADPTYKLSVFSRPGEFTEDMRAELRQEVHRFNSVFGLDTGALLLEANQSKGIARVLYVDPDTRLLHRFEGNPFVRSSNGPTTEPFVDYVVGSSGDTLVGLVHEPDKARWLDEYDSAIRKPGLTNPALVLMRFKHPSGAKVSFANSQNGFTLNSVSRPGVGGSAR